jgi:SAM-dependent methyltransferase
MAQDPITFSFGENWQDFVQRYFSEERVSIAQRHLLDFIETPSLSGSAFVDIGCGSGIHSLAAFRAWARHIISFDIDPRSVETTERIRDAYGDASRWEIAAGSVLDTAFLATIQPAEVVYSWGVLHHTGKMWEAVRNAATLVRNSGLFYTGLYTTDSRSDHWTRTKKRYNRASRFGKRFMEMKHVIRYLLLSNLARGRNPIRVVREYPRRRGMSWFTDMRDWLGGYPYEHARPEEVLRFCRKTLDFELVNLKTGEAETEYLFKKR